MGEHSLVGKDDNLLDALVRIPLVISCPKNFRPSTCNAFVNLTDVYATLLELAGSKRGVPQESRSLVFLLKEHRDPKFSDRVFMEHNGTSLFTVVRGIRNNEYKYVFRPHEFDELYDLRSDPFELNNVILDSHYNSVVTELKRELVEWMTDTGDMAAKGARHILLDKEQTV